LLDYPDALPPKQSPKKDPSGLVLGVIDGNTISVKLDGKTETVRLLGVDTPEHLDHRKPVQYLASESTWLATQLALDQWVRLEVQEEPNSRDKRGRLLAYAFRKTDGLFINNEVVRQGFGFAYLNYHMSQLRKQEFAAAEREARENKRGLWAAVLKNYDEFAARTDEPRAQTWIRTGLNLAKTNRSAAREWFEKVLSEYPSSTQAGFAREWLGRPPSKTLTLPPMDAGVALDVLTAAGSWTIARPNLAPHPPRSKK
jgi:micrococcal nuclease